MQPCKRNHDIALRYRDRRGKLACRGCAQVRRRGLVRTNPATPVTGCRQGHSAEHRYRTRFDQLNCRQCRRDIGKRRKRRPAYDATRYQTRRTAALTILGGCCTCCGQDQEIFLQFDHIHNDGAEHRRQLGGALPRAIHREVVKTPKTARLKYQVLCANCNWAKRMDTNHVCTAPTPSAGAAGRSEP